MLLRVVQSVVSAVASSVTTAVVATADIVNAVVTTPIKNVVYTMRRTPARATVPSVRITLTTLPSRVKYLRSTIASLLLQTVPCDVYIHVPEQCAAEPDSLYAFPAWILEHPNVHVFRTPEYRSATKFIPAILFHEDYEGSWIVVDDDMIYAPNLVEKFLEHASANTVVCARGWKIGRDWAASKTVFSERIAHQRRVAVVTGCGGYMLPPAVVRALRPVIAAYPEDPEISRAFRRMDDVWISTNLTRIGVAKFVVPGIRRQSNNASAMFTVANLSAKRAQENDVVIRNSAWAVEEIE